jgi:hypothetical protein
MMGESEEEERTGNTVSFKVLTQERLATTAVETFSTELRVISTDTFTDCKSFNIFSDGSDDTDGFVTCEVLEL